MSGRATLVKPSPVDPSKSAIENVLELTALTDIGPDIYTNTRALWHPPGARGIFGGAVIAQCLSAAQRTVPSNFTVHSMHCYFVLAGDSETPIIYHVEHVREGRSFATRTVQARQRGKCIFTTTLSFVRENSAGPKTIYHAVPLPQNIRLPVDPPAEQVKLERAAIGNSPFESQRIEILNAKSAFPHEKKTRQWIRARGRISDEGGHQAHLSALAYMSDSYFIGTVSRIHGLWRWGQVRKEFSSRLEGVSEEEKDKYIKRMKDIEGFGDDPENEEGRPQVGMMVSLDHTIYFHEPRSFRADEWMFTEMESPWSGDGRGLVMQHMFSKDGTLIATCVQEGLVRLKSDEEISSAKSKL
ncbi:acyl-CoA thioesterase-like protein II [Xylogone sp. PMI_703]|nr:acyl-CoA thioesterase-like protein II [Xylogone sp. PMI_703]